MPFFQTFLREYFHKMLCLHHCLNDWHDENLTEMAAFLKKCFFPKSEPVPNFMLVYEFERFCWNTPLICCTIGIWVSAKQRDVNQFPTISKAKHRFPNWTWNWIKAVRTLSVAYLSFNSKIIMSKLFCCHAIAWQQNNLDNN